MALSAQVYFQPLPLSVSHPLSPQNKLCFSPAFPLPSKPTLDADATKRPMYVSGA